MSELNLTWVVPHLALGGSFSTATANELSRDLKIRAVIDLRAEACDDRAALRLCGIDLLHLPTDDHCAVAKAMLDEGVAFAGAFLDRQECVLIHCEHGIGRSATLALCVLVSRGMAPLDALEIAKSRRPLVSPSPAQYEAWVAWLSNWRRTSGASWQEPSFDAFKAIAYRHLPGALR
jgi:protein-tyrosine phosphatase